MYAISNACRVYITSFLLLCAAFFLAPTVVIAADVPTTLRPDIQDMVREVRKDLNSNVNRPPSTSLSTSSSAPTITKNPTGGLSATTNNILRNMGLPSTFNSTSNYSLNSAKNALKSCVRSPACAVRTLGGGAIIYDGIRAWKDVYDLTLGDDDQLYKPASEYPAPSEAYDIVPPYDDSLKTSYYRTTGRITNGNIRTNPNQHPLPANTTLVAVSGTEGSIYRYACYNRYQNSSSGLPLVGYTGSRCEYDLVDEPPTFPQSPPPVPVPPSELDYLIDQGYDPQPSDAPIVITGGGSPESIELTTPVSVELPSSTKTITDSNGQTSTAVTNRTINYNVTNNNTANPSISSSITETTNTYDNSGNLTQTETSTTTEQGIPQDAPSAGASADVELPVFCTWAKPLCDWLNWTQEDMEGEEPDLINLISEFEPDEQQYNSGIGLGSCPAPMSLNLGIINRTVEVSYQPFCDFLDMIRPLVIAGAWLLSAFMYVGVLRRG